MSREKKMANVLGALDHLIKTLPGKYPGQQVYLSLAVFNDQFKFLQEDASFKQVCPENEAYFLELFKSLKPAGSTDFCNALEKSIAFIEKATALVIVSDGASNEGKTGAELKDYINKWNVKIPVYTIGMGLESDSKMLDLISNNKASDLSFHVEDSDMFANVLFSIIFTEARKSIKNPVVTVTAEKGIRMVNCFTTFETSFEDPKYVEKRLTAMLDDLTQEKIHEILKKRVAMEADKRLKNLTPDQFKFMIRKHAQGPLMDEEKKAIVLSALIGEISDQLSKDSNMGNIMIKEELKGRVQKEIDDAGLKKKIISVGNLVPGQSFNFGVKLSYSKVNKDVPHVKKDGLVEQPTINVTIDYVDSNNVARQIVVPTSKLIRSETGSTQPTGSPIFQFSFRDWANYHFHDVLSRAIKEISCEQNRYTATKKASEIFNPFLDMLKSVRKLPYYQEIDAEISSILGFSMNNQETYEEAIKDQQSFLNELNEDRVQCENFFHQESQALGKFINDESKLNHLMSMDSEAFADQFYRFKEISEDPQFVEALIDHKDFLHKFEEKLQSIKDREALLELISVKNFRDLEINQMIEMAMKFKGYFCNMALNQHIHGMIFAHINSYRKQRYTFTDCFDDQYIAEKLKQIASGHFVTISTPPERQVVTEKQGIYRKMKTYLTQADRDATQFAVGVEGSTARYVSL